MEGSMQFVVRLVIFIAAIVFHPACQAAPTLDASFGDNGKVRIQIPPSAPANSFNVVDTIVVDSSGGLLLVAFANETGAFDPLITRLLVNFLVSRYKPDGALDTYYGTNGRLSPNQPADFSGIPRAVIQPDGSLVVIAGTGMSVGTGVPTVGRVAAFRVTPGGTLDNMFTPSLARPMVGYTTVALGMRPDGRLLYATPSYVANGGSAVVLQQMLADGNPDPNFGTGGTVSFPLLANETSRRADLAILDDGSVLVAVLTTEYLRVFKVDANGMPVTTFGIVGQFLYPGGSLNEYIVGSAVTLFALGDGNLLATINVYDGSMDWLRVVRISANGNLMRAFDLLRDPGAYQQFNVVAMSDGSAVIARSMASKSAPTSGKAELYRLLPDDSLDLSFGPGGAFLLAGISGVNGLALEPDGKLLVSGGEPVAGSIPFPSVVERLELFPQISSVPVREYFNVNQGHYFLAAEPGEIAAVEGGAAGPGWQRTGNDFRAFIPKSGIPSGTLPVCRFRGTPDSGPNSHFYSIDSGECAAVKNNPGWIYEGSAFYLFVPRDGVCATGLHPVYRAYYNGYQQNGPNHRYAANLDLLQSMTTQGWSLEGIAFCAPAN